MGVYKNLHYFSKEIITENTLFSKKIFAQHLVWFQKAFIHISYQTTGTYWNTQSPVIKDEDPL